VALLSQNLQSVVEKLRYVKVGHDRLHVQNSAFVIRNQKIQAFSCHWWRKIWLV